MKVADSSKFLLWRKHPEPDGEWLSVEEKLLVGRSRKCHLVLDDVLVSRSHAIFSVKDERLFLTDMTSRNGTFVNEKQINSSELRHDDWVKIGREEFRVVFQSGLFESVELEQELSNDQTLIQQVTDEKAVTHQVFKHRLVLDHQPLGHITDGFLAQERRGTKLKEREAPPEREEREVQRSKWFDVIFKVHLEIQTSTDEQQFGDAVCALLLDVLDSDRCLVALLQEGEHLKIQNIRHRVTDDAATERPKQTHHLHSVSGSNLTGPVQMSRTVTEQVLNQRCAINIHDIRRDERFGESDSLLLSPVRSMLVSPIMIENKVLGLIEVSRSDSVEVFTESGLELLSIVASMLGAALNNFEQSRRQESYIRELQNTHEQLRAAQADLVRTQQLAILGRMASSINHEIGNLFMPLLEYHQSKQEGVPEEDLLFSSNELAYCCTQIQSLIEDIKYFSQGAHRPPEKRESRLDEQIVNAVRFVQIDRNLFPKGGARPLQPQLEILARPKVLVDPLQIGRVVINLLRNAAQAMLNQEEAPEIIVRVKRTIDSAVIEVEDNGPGVPEQIQSKLFEPFFTTKGEQGLGLGLDISRKIVHSHNGKITFERNAAERTCFRITLPLQPTYDNMRTPIEEPETPLPNRGEAAKSELDEGRSPPLAQRPLPRAQQSDPLRDERATDGLSDESMNERAKG